MSARSRKKRKLKAEINVVPYIDVMLVLLIIFMVTAPLLNLGVDIELPQSNAKPVETQKDPIVVEVTSDGRYFLTLQKAASEELDADTLVAKVGAFVRQNPEVQVLIAGDTRTDYGTVYQGMVLLQQAGVARVGLMSKPAED
ncbi:MAG: protein TolR [Lysobacteraceae bacterium]|jgi:biopolymer transport protein TolR|nr:protein TolR [Xanthomonadales bacterium]HRD73124.1 protein TolR [Aquimonas sp.]HRF54062.1 protein TolR [Aquimonas sp.]